MLELMLIAALAGLPPAASGAPGFIDSATLVSACTADGPEGPAKTAICLGYIAGAMDQLMRAQAALGPEERTICPPRGLTINRARQAVVRRAGSAAAAPPLGAAAFVTLAFEDAFPCGHAADGN